MLLLIKPSRTTRGEESSAYWIVTAVADLALVSDVCLCSSGRLYSSVRQTAVGGVGGVWHTTVAADVPQHGGEVRGRAK